MQPALSDVPAHGLTMRVVVCAPCPPTCSACASCRAPVGPADAHGWKRSSALPCATGQQWEHGNEHLRVFRVFILTCCPAGDYLPEPSEESCLLCANVQWWECGYILLRIRVNGVGLPPRRGLPAGAERGIGPAVRGGRARAGLGGAHPPPLGALEAALRHRARRHQPGHALPVRAEGFARFWGLGFLAPAVRHRARQHQPGHALLVRHRVFRVFRASRLLNATARDGTSLATLHRFAASCPLGTSGVCLHHLPSVAQGSACEARREENVSQLARRHPGSSMARCCCAMW